MKPRYSFSSRKGRRARDSPKMRKQKDKYPSIAEKIIEQSDIILQILDARFIQDTRNFEIEKEIKNKNKKIIFVLNKSDLTKKFKKEELQNLKPNVLVSCKLRRGIKELRDKIKATAKKIKTDSKISVGVIGYPNTGKSSLINLLIGKSSAGVGSDAGFTKGLQKLKLSQNILLIDSPGVIPSKEYSSTNEESIAKHTKVGGRSYSQVKYPDMVVNKLVKEFPGILEKHYKIKTKGNSEILLEELGKKFNYFKKGGIVDEDKIARKILKDWQVGVIRI